MAEFIDPAKVPKRTLYTGEQIPAIGMGTFGSDRFTAEQISNAVAGAIKVGYRLFDGASVYGNEDQIGEVYAKAIKSGIVKREELYLTSKLWNDKHAKGDILVSFGQTLKDLQLDYIDLYFVHWPFPNYHPPGCAEDYRSPDARPFFVEEFMETWRQLERLVKAGYIRHLGTSNTTIPKLKQILKHAEIKPVANEMELHPCFQQTEMYDYCIENGVQPIGFCPIGSPTRPDRDKTEEDFVDIQQPELVEIAKKHGVHPAVICIKWAVQRGQIPIPFSVYENEYTSNLKCVTEDLLSDEEMETLKSVDKAGKGRLIKGQVFLWHGANDWKDLWDLDGTINRTGYQG